MEDKKKEFEQYKGDIQTVLRYAEKLITGDRLQDYGSPEESFKRIAKMWSAFKGVEFTAQEVALMMSLLKISRLANSIDHYDSWIDLLGYVAIGSTLGEEDGI